jgi:RNA polymerase sigma-70 factor (ECF subfamily)
MSISSTLSPHAGHTADGACSPALRRELVHLARLHTTHDDLAGEAVQDVLVLLWRRRTPPADLRRWLRAAVLHRCRHHARTRARAQRRDRDAASLRPELDADSDPACVVCERELRERLRAALQTLPPTARRALELRALRGLDYDAIAEHLGIPIGTVRSSLHRARAALREKLADWLVADEYDAD